MADITIHNANCFDVLEAWDGPPVDFLFADLPYGTTRNKWDSVLDLARLWPLLRKVCKPNAAMCFTSQQPFTTTLIASNMSEFRYDWVWHKTNRATGFMNAQRMPLKAHENVAVFYRALPTYNPQMSEGKPYSVGRTVHRSTNMATTSVRPKAVDVKTRYPTTILPIKADLLNGAKRYPLHPTQKPVPLLEYLIRTYSNPGDLVLDPTAGALTTAVAAHNTGRRAVCVELLSEYVDLGIRRLTDAGADFCNVT